MKLKSFNFIKVTFSEHYDILIKFIHSFRIFL